VADCAKIRGQTRYFRPNKGTGTVFWSSCPAPDSRPRICEMISLFDRVLRLGTLAACERRTDCIRPTGGGKRANSARRRRPRVAMGVVRRAITQGLEVLVVCFWSVGVVAGADFADFCRGHRPKGGLVGGPEVPIYRGEVRRERCDVLGAAMFCRDIVGGGDTKTVPC